MSLPKLPDFNDEFEEDEIQINKEIEVKEVEREIEPDNDKKLKGKPRIPKSQYDNEGNPVLLIPNLDDVNLNSEIEKYFGREEE